MHSLRRRLLMVVLLVMPCLTAGMTLAPAHVSAAEESVCTAKEYAGFFGFPKWYKYLSPTFNDKTKGCDITFNFKSSASYVGIGLVLFEILMRIAGMAALAFVLYGAFQFLTSQGEPDKIAAGRATLTNALVGLIIALLAVAAVNLIGANIV